MTDSVQYPRSRWLVLIAAVISYISLQVTNLAMAPVLPQIAASLNINLGSASNLAMTTFLFSGSIVLVLVGGVICDRYGVPTSIIIGTLCAAVPAALMPWLGHSTMGIFWARLVEGCAPGFLFPAMSPIISLWFPNHQKGLAGGIMSAAVAVGSAGGVMGGPLIFAVVKNWQAMCAWLSLVAWAGFVFAVVLALMPKPQLPAQAAAPAGGSSDGAMFRRALFSSLTVYGALVTFMACWCMQCLYSLTSTFLAADKPVGAGYGAMTAGQLMLGVTLFAGVIGPIVCGVFLDKVFKGNARSVFLIGYALLCVFVYALNLPMVTGRVPVLEIVLILAGFGVQFVMPTVYYFVAKAYAPQLAGKMSGIWTGIGNVGGVLGLYIAGVTVKSQGNYHTTLSLQALAALLGFCLVFGLAAAAKKPAPSTQTAGAGM